MPINQITKIRFENGKEVALVDWTDRPLYSTIEVLDGTTQQEMNFFQYTVGQNVPAFAPVPVTAQRIATDRDTNLADPGGMASTEEFLLFAIRPEVFQLEVADEQNPDFAAPAPLNNVSEPLPFASLFAVLNLRCLLNLEISDKVYANAGFGYYNAGHGVLVQGSDPATLGTGNNGMPQQEAVRGFSIPMHMGGQEKFRVYLSNPAGVPLEVGAGFGSVDQQTVTKFARIVVYLDGLYKRPVS